MAGSVAGVIGWGVSDGETIDSPATRWSTVSRFDVVGGGSPLQSRGGIIPTAGTPAPLSVTALGTPAMFVTINAGSCVIPGNNATTPPFGLTLTTNTNLTIGTAHASLARIDLVVAHIYSDGTSASYGEFAVIAGTPNATPVRPTVPNTGNDHSIVLSTVQVGAAVTVINSANVSVQTATDTGFTAAPGGMVRVPTLALGAGLPVGTPFFSDQDKRPGVVYPHGAELNPGILLRYFAGIYYATGSGDVSNITFGHYVNGAFAVKTFPNGFLGAVVTDATPVANVNGLLTAKTVGGTTTGLNIRLYDASGAPTTLTGPFTLNGLVWGY